MRNNAAPPTLLIHNLFNYGHFLVYADTLTKWALSRGWRTILMGRGLGRTAYARRYAGNLDVSLRDSDPGCHMDQNQADMFKARIVEPALDELLEAQTALRPQISILLTTDELIFRAERLRDEGFSFPTPTVGLVTFGHRDHYLGFKDCYARRLDRILATRRPFSRILTLDEFQVAFHDPGQEYLIFLPDIYAEPDRTNDDGTDGEQASVADELQAFLDRGSGPVLPVLGKIDQRKNASWVLRLVRDTPAASCVMLGERVHGPADNEINALLAELSDQGRAFTCFDYVPESLFSNTLRNPRTNFMPLPYSCHYGSSGIQLQAIAAGKPTLTPNVGLMAMRTSGHGLGLCYEAGNEADFRRKATILLRQGPADYSKNLQQFIGCFTPQVRFAQLDMAFDSTCGDTGVATRLTSQADSGPREMAQAMEELLAGRALAALGRLNVLGARAPVHALNAPLLLRQALALNALERHAEAQKKLRRCIEAGGAEEMLTLLRARVDEAAQLLHQGQREQALAELRATTLLVPQASPLPDPLPAETQELVPVLVAGILTSQPLLDHKLWHQLGAILAQTGMHDAAVASFRRAIQLAPAAHGYWLNLSDVLRYAKRLEEAWSSLEKLEALSPLEPGLHHKRGQVLFEQGKLDKAREEFLREKPDGEFGTAAREYLTRLGATPSD